VKPVPFDYAAPTSLDEALALLDEDARPLAGGQSLVPLLNFRLARPRLVVDVNGVPGLSAIRLAEGALRIGALVRQAALERSSLVEERWPVLRVAARHVAHQAIRNRGTVGGSVAHADPAAELPCALAALGARFHARSKRGARTLEAADFFLGPLQTALEPDELLVEIEVPPVPDGTRQGFAEHARTHGDFALACVAVVGDRIALGGVAPTTIVVSSLDEARIDDPYRRALVAELVRRAS
jgi:CO/xanthine dehydrogenase FAD-binding subunit